MLVTLSFINVFKRILIQNSAPNSSALESVLLLWKSQEGLVMALQLILWYIIFWCVIPYCYHAPKFVLFLTYNLISYETENVQLQYRVNGTKDSVFKESSTHLLVLRN